MDFFMAEEKEIPKSKSEKHMFSRGISAIKTSASYFCEG
jgi:hypothetical protein